MPKWLAKVPSLWLATVGALKCVLIYGKESQTVIKLRGIGMLNRIKCLANTAQSKLNPLWYTSTTGRSKLEIQVANSCKACLTGFAGSGLPFLKSRPL